MVKRRIDFNYKALQLQMGITVEGNVPGRQSYNAYAGEFIPDYTVVPLVLQPTVSIIDRDGILTDGVVNGSLTNITWTQIIDGAETSVTDGTISDYYAIDASGDTAGRLTVSKNAAPDFPITLVFSAKYTDTRTKQIHTINMSYLLFCGQASDEINVSLDCADTTLYNPFVDAATQVVTATVLRAGKEVEDTTRYNLLWERLGDDDTWHTVGTDMLDYMITVADDGSYVTVDRSLVPGEAKFRCRVQYEPDANASPDDVEINEGLPCKYFNFERRLPYYEFDFSVPDLPPDAEVVSAEAMVWGVNGDISNYEDELVPVWSVATNTDSGNNLTYTQVAVGGTVEISTSYLNQTYGAVINLEMEDRGAPLPWVDATDGAIIVDYDETAEEGEQESIILLH